jgi:hypothetical protein
MYLMLSNVSIYFQLISYRHLRGIKGETVASEVEFYEREESGENFADAGSPGYFPRLPALNLPIRGVGLLIPAD